jgi:hypothetical protein
VTAKAGTPFAGIRRARKNENRHGGGKCKVVNMPLHRNIPFALITLIALFVSGCDGCSGNGGSNRKPTPPPTVSSSFQSNGIDPALLAKAQAGDSAAEYQVGLEYDKGKEVPQDFDKAAMWYQKAAEQGDAGAEVNLGLLYGRGEGVPRDEAQANVWFRKAAEQGNATAQFDLGISYRDGKGVPQNYAQSAMWFRKAAEQGDARAKDDLDKIQSEIQSENKGSNSLSYWPTTIRVDTDMDSSWLADEERTCQTYPNDNGRIAVVACNQLGSHRDRNIPVKFWGDPDRNISSNWKCRREKSIFSDTFVCRAID